MQGLVNQMYSRQNTDITGSIHHFLDEENEHMAVFAEWCSRYAGNVYQDKKIALGKKYTKGAEDATFFIKEFIAEEPAIRCSRPSSCEAGILWRSQAKAKTELEDDTPNLECLEIFRNRGRRHSAFGMVSPVEYEMQQTASTAA